MRIDFFRSAKGPKRILITAMLVTMILIVLCPILVICAQKIAGGAENPGGNPGNSKTPGSDGITYTSLPVASSDVYTKGSLLVVNNSTPIVTYPSDDQLLQIYGENKSSSYKVKISSLRLRGEALDAFNDMLDAYYTETNDGSVIITSAYRTEAEQAALTTSAVKAGYSDHHLALSVALKLNDGSVVSELPTDHWLYENGYKYGYIQRYPAGKEDSTGDTQAYYNCLRYVGVPHATYINEHDLSLEEYIETVKGYTYDGSHLAVTAGGASYEIYYVQANLTGTDDAITTLPVPAGLEYTYAGNNTDGFIVTVKMPQG